MAEFDEKKQLLENFRVACERLICQILDSENIHVHSVNSRLKNRGRLSEKIQRIGKRYKSLCEITDVVGLRIITHFEDDVDRIGSLIEREFQTDRDKSIDKRKALEADRFGYLSLHYICALNQDRKTLIEYKQFRNLLCEIQIRSILQHAWAEIEHDLGYKAGSAIPVPARRRFSRLAGLLELADMEFRHLRDELSSYTAQVSDAIFQEPANVNIDSVSLKAFIKSNSICLELDMKLASLLHCTLIDTDDDIDWTITTLNYLGLQTISDLHDALKQRKRVIVEQSRERIKIESDVDDSDQDYTSRGICLYHLFQVMIAETKDVKAIKGALDQFSIGDDRERFAQMLIDIVERLTT